MMKIHPPVFFAQNDECLLDTVQVVSVFLSKLIILASWLIGLRKLIQIGTLRRDYFAFISSIIF